MTQYFTRDLRLAHGDNVDVGVGSVSSGRYLVISFGTSSTPDTIQNPLAKVSRTMEMSSSGISPSDGADKAACIFGINEGTVNNQVQTVGVLGYAKSSSTYSGTTGGDDACGVYGEGRIINSGTGNGIGGYFAGRRDTDTGGATPIQLNCINSTSTAGTYNPTGFSNTTGAFIAAGGSSDSGLGIGLDNAFGFQFSVGLGFNGHVLGGKTGPVKDSSIRDDSSSTTSLDIRGTHTTAISVAAGAGSSTLLNDVTLGDTDGADNLTINAATWTYGNNWTATRAAGTVATGTINLSNYALTATGDSGGASNIRGLIQTLSIQGSNNVLTATTFRYSFTHSGSGTITNGFGINSSVDINSTGNVTTATGAQTSLSLISSGSVTTGICFNAGSTTLSSTGAITTNVGFNAANLGHATLVTNAIGFNATSMTTSATLTASFRSQQNSGTGVWGFLHTGTANNALNGNTRIGSTTAPTSTLDVTGTAAISSTLGVTGVTTFGAPARLKGYTVATLPAGVVGYMAYVTDLLAPTYLATAVGGGAITGPVFYDGTNWVSI